MASKKILVGVAAAIVFVIGAGSIVYMGRPVMKNPPPTTVDGQKGSYTMADVQSHSTRSSCWSAINGNVYDLSSWISRHPGGEGPILSLCGTDGTDAYTNQHGGQGRPASMLALLKIGALAK